MQQKWWSILFGVVLLAILVLCVVSPFVGWWLPENVASTGGDVDYLFYVICGFTGFFFVLTEVILVWALWRYGYQPGHKAVYVEGNHRLEVAWTIVPAGILLFIAFAQVKAWQAIKYPSQMSDKTEHVVEVSARQWEWRLRYPADLLKEPPASADSEAGKKARAAWARQWSEVPEADDLYVENELHTWKGAEVKIYLKTQDVLHSFGIPTLRLMQDALPGKTIPMWFQATKANTRFNAQTGKCEEPEDPRDAWEIACKELCGGRHYAMRGRLYVHQDKEDYKQWLGHMLDLQKSHTDQPPAGRVARQD